MVPWLVSRRNPNWDMRSVADRGELGATSQTRSRETNDIIQPPGRTGDRAAVHIAACQGRSIHASASLHCAPQLTYDPCTNNAMHTREDA